MGIDEIPWNLPGVNGHHDYNGNGRGRYDVLNATDRYSIALDLATGFSSLCVESDLGNFGYHTLALQGEQCLEQSPVNMIGIFPKFVEPSQTLQYFVGNRALMPGHVNLSRYLPIDMNTIKVDQGRLFGVSEYFADPEFSYNSIYATVQAAQQTDLPLAVMAFRGNSLNMRQTSVALTYPESLRVDYALGLFRLPLEPWFIQLQTQIYQLQS